MPTPYLTTYDFVNISSHQWPHFLAYLTKDRCCSCDCPFTMTWKTGITLTTIAPPKMCLVYTRYCAMRNARCLSFFVCTNRNGMIILFRQVVTAGKSLQAQFRKECLQNRTQSPKGRQRSRMPTEVFMNSLLSFVVCKLIFLINLQPEYCLFWCHLCRH